MVRALLIQRGSPLNRFSDNALSLREFATFVVGKKNRNVGGCRA